MRLLSSVRIGQGAGNGEAGMDHCVEEGVPTGASDAVRAHRSRLLKRVVDRDRKGRMRMFGEPMHRLRHTVEEECLRLLLAAVTVGRGDQFLGFGHGQCSEEVREDGLQGAAQPDVEEIRQVGVADVVVVRRVGAYDAPGRRDSDASLPVWHAAPLAYRRGHHPTPWLE